MEYDAKDIQSVVFLEPDTNTVVIKIVGFPNKDMSKLYISWIMDMLDFDYSSTDGIESTSIN